MRKSFNMGIVIPQKKRNYGECKNDILCDRCDNLVNQNKEIFANLNERKRQAPNEFRHILPKNISI